MKAIKNMQQQQANRYVSQLSDDGGGGGGDCGNGQVANCCKFIGLDILKIVT